MTDFPTIYTIKLVIIATGPQYAGKLYGPRMKRKVYQL